MRGTMLAERHDSRTKEVRLEEIPVPEPGPGEVLILAEMLSYGRLDLSESSSQIVPLSRVEEGIEALATKKGSPIRIFVQP